jgi:hypothetical protein
MVKIVDQVVRSGGLLVDIGPGGGCSADALGSDEDAFAAGEDGGAAANDLAGGVFPPLVGAGVDGGDAEDVVGEADGVDSAPGVVASVEQGEIDPLPLSR